MKAMQIMAALALLVVTIALAFAEPMQKFLSYRGT